MVGSVLSGVYQTVASPLNTIKTYSGRIHFLVEESLNPVKPTVADWEERNIYVMLNWVTVTLNVVFTAALLVSMFVIYLNTLFVISLVGAPLTFACAHLSKHFIINEEKKTELVEKNYALDLRKKELDKRGEEQAKEKEELEVNNQNLQFQLDNSHELSEQLQQKVSQLTEQHDLLQERTDKQKETIEQYNEKALNILKVKGAAKDLIEQLANSDHAIEAVLSQYKQFGQMLDKPLQKLSEFVERADDCPNCSPKKTRIKGL